MSKKRILITGAGSGFGRAAAMRLAERGHDVIAAVQLRSQISDLRKEAAAKKLSLRVDKLDVLSEIDRRHALTWEIDVLVNNAGIAESGPVAEIPMEIFRSVFEVNVFGNLALSQGFAKQMAKRGSGRILFVSSISGLSTTPFAGTYCASKHALEAVAEAMHVELKPHGITVATINPGMYLTGFNDRMAESFLSWYDPKVNFTRTENMGPLGKLGGANDGFEVLPKGAQADPEEMIQLYVEMAEADSGFFRNVLPKQTEEMLKRLHQDAWTQKQ